MKLWSGTTRRLFFAFAPLVLFFAVASYAALAGIAQMHDAVHAVNRHEEGVRLALELASAVRDQYAHQAHTIIIGDKSHLGFYEKAQQRVLRLTAQVDEHAQDPEAHAWVLDIERTSQAIDRLFRGQILPAVLAHDTPRVQAEHARAQELVSFVQDRADRLVGRFEESMGDFEEHAGVVQHATFRWMFAGLLAATLFAVGVALYIGRSIARPLAKLEEGAARLAAGDLDTRIHIDAPDEFGRLASQFNAMTAAIKEHQEQLVQSEKLAGIGRLAAGVAHEINNPLGVILGYVRVLRKKAQGSLAEDLEVIEDEAVRCQEIVDGLLALSRPASASGGPVNLRELCDEVVARLREAGHFSEVSITVEGAGIVEGQGPRLRQVVLNLVKNAAEAAGPGGTVGVQVAPTDGGQVCLSVTDTGPGVPAESRERLFEPFFTTKPAGTGLGLAVSQAIAQAHGGSIELGAQEAKGATFTLRLPRFEQVSA